MWRPHCICSLHCLPIKSSLLQSWLSNELLLQPLLINHSHLSQHASWTIESLISCLQHILQYNSSRQGFLHPYVHWALSTSVAMLKAAWNQYILSTRPSKQFCSRKRNTTNSTITTAMLTRMTWWCEILHCAFAILPHSLKALHLFNTRSFMPSRLHLDT